MPIPDGLPEPPPAIRPAPVVVALPAEVEEVVDKAVEVADVMVNWSVELSVAKVVALLAAVDDEYAEAVISVEFKLERPVCDEVGSLAVVPDSVNGNATHLVSAGFGELGEGSVQEVVMLPEGVAVGKGASITVRELPLSMLGTDAMEEK